MIDSSNHRHASPGLSTIRRELRSWMVSARAEQLRGGSLSLEKGFAEPFGEGSHRLHRADEIAEAAFLVPVDEFDVGPGIDLQPFKNRWQIVRNAAALAFDDGTAGPVHQFHVVLDLIGNRSNMDTHTKGIAGDQSRR